MIIEKEQVLRFLADSGTPLTKRELARAFGIKGDDRTDFRDLLKSMEEEGLVVRLPGKEYAVPEGLPSVAIIEITGIDIDGDLFARPVQWDENQGAPPRIEVKPEKKGHPSLAARDRVLARLIRTGKNDYEAKIIRRLDIPQGRVMGMVNLQRRGGAILQPTDKKAKHDFEIDQKDLNGAGDGDMAICEIQPTRGMRTKKVRVVEVIGHRSDRRAISLISLHEVGIRPDFPAEVLKSAEGLKVPSFAGREDLTVYPLVTIDGADARDFDDAVFAQEAEGGYHLIVAIADVSYYVHPGSQLDREAYRRGNSTYFPDRVVPMLPEALSNDLCSLRPGENRACLAVHMHIDTGGRLLRHKFVRGIMRSQARLTYEQVQSVHDGLTKDDELRLVIEPLYEAFAILDAARRQRGALDLDLPEKKIDLDENNNMVGVSQRVRLDSHRLIEEFMVLANVAAAQELEKRKAPCVYRVHDAPSLEKLDSAREFLKSFNLSIPRGQVVRPAQLNQLLAKAESHPYKHLINEVILRAQAQAHYSPENIGHYGLSLSRYAHFTSPIRRYADLVVHRSLVRALGLGKGGLEKEEEVRLEEICEHISDTERISMEAECNAVDRFTSAFLSDKIGAQFAGRIKGVTRFGLFVELEQTGADGFVPMRTLPDDYYVHDEEKHALIGRHSGRVYRMGAGITVELCEADPLTGSTILSVVGRGGADIPGMELEVRTSRRNASRGRGKARRRRK